MSERRGLLDPEMYKISEEDSQDEEVLSSLHMMRVREKKVESEVMSPSQPNTRYVMGKVEWPMKDEFLSGESSSETDESRESESWTSSSTPDDDESDDADWSSCSSCKSKSISNLFQGDKNGQRRKFTTFPSRFTRKDQSKKSGSLNESNYFISKKDIERNTDPDGNVRLIEFYSSETPTVESEDEDKSAEDGRVELGDDAWDEESQRSKIQISKTFSRFTRKSSFLEKVELKKNIRKQMTREGQMSQLLNSNSPTRQISPGHYESSPMESSMSNIERVFSPSPFDGDLHHLTLTLTNENNSSHGHQGTLLESLLGIIPITDKSKWSSRSFPFDPQSHGSRLHPHHHQQVDKDRRGGTGDEIVIGGFYSNSPAAKSRHLQIGDWVHTINGIVVNRTNVDFILSAIQQRHPRGHSTAKHEIKLTCIREPTPRTDCNFDKKPRGSGSIEVNPEHKVIPTEKKRRPRQNGAKFSSGIRKLEDFESGSSVARVPNADVLSTVYILFIEQEKEKQIISFTWPPKEMQNEMSNKILTKLEEASQMFPGIYHSLKDVSGYLPLRSEILVGDVVMEITFFSDDDGASLLVMVVSLWKVKAEGFTRTSSFGLVERVGKVLILKWGTLRAACRSVNCDLLNDLLRNLLHDFCINDDVPFPNYPLPAQLNLQILELLWHYVTEFEVMGTTSTEEECANVVGTVIFYKGKVACDSVEAVVVDEFYSWIKAELHNFGNRINGPVKRCVLWQRNLTGEKVRLVVGKNHVFMGTVVECLSYKMKSCKTPFVKWIQEAAQLLLTIEKELKKHIIEKERLPISSNQPNHPLHLDPQVFSKPLTLPKRQGKISSAITTLKTKIFHRPATEDGMTLKINDDTSFGKDIKNKTEFGSEKSFSSVSSSQKGDEKELLLSPSASDLVKEDGIMGTVTSKILNQEFLLHVSRVEGGRYKFLLSEERWKRYGLTWSQLHQGIHAVDDVLQKAYRAPHNASPFKSTTTIPKEFGILFHFEDQLFPGKKQSVWVIGREDYDGGRTFICFLDKKHICPEVIETIFHIALSTYRTHD